MPPHRRVKNSGGRTAWNRHRDAKAAAQPTRRHIYSKARLATAVATGGTPPTPSEATDELATEATSPEASKSDAICRQNLEANKTTDLRARAGP